MFEVRHIRIYIKFLLFYTESDASYCTENSDEDETDEFSEDIEFSEIKCLKRKKKRGKNNIIFLYFKYCMHKHLDIKCKNLLF